MTMVVVFGGAGFLGRRLVHRLTAEGMAVRVAVRHPDSARIELRAIGLGRVTAVPADVRDQSSVAAAIAGADAVVNTVSAYVEKNGVTFEAVHDSPTKKARSAEHHNHGHLSFAPARRALGSWHRRGDDFGGNREKPRTTPLSRLSAKRV